MLIQAACSILEDPGIVLASLLDRMDLTHWALMTKEDSKLPDETFDIADEFLLITIGILSEKYSTEISEISFNEELKHRLIQILVIGERSHSEVERSVHKDCDKTLVLVEEILQEISNLVPSKKDTTKKVYQLKKNYEEFINPFYYFVTRAQRDEIDANTFSTDFFKKPPCAKGPKLKSLFQGLSKLAWSNPLMTVFNSVFERWLQNPEKNSMLIKHLHKVIYLINIGLNNDFENKKPEFIKVFDEKGLYSTLKKVRYQFCK